MSGAAAQFFAKLGERGHEPLLEKATGTLLFELTDGDRSEQWLVSVKRGDVTVSRAADGAADCTVHADEAFFGRVARGETNATAAVLRGALEVTGDPSLLMLFQRIFPGPPK